MGAGPEGPAPFLFPGGSQPPQQTGTLPRQTQQVQTAFIMADMQSQHAWIITQQSSACRKRA